MKSEDEHAFELDRCCRMEGYSLEVYQSQKL